MFLPLRELPDFSRRPERLLEVAKIDAAHRLGVDRRTQAGQLDENPFQRCGILREHVFDDPEFLRRHHAVDGDVERAHRHAARGQRLIEHFRHDAVTRPAGADKDGVNFVLVLGEPGKLRVNLRHVRQRQKLVDDAAGERERGEADQRV